MSPSTDAVTAPPAPPPAKPRAPRRAHHIPELLVIHADELAYLWGQRRAGMFDARYTLKSFLGLLERIDAHLKGLLTVPSALPRLLGPRLAEATDRDDAFAAACPLLKLENPALTGPIVEAFAMSDGERLLGLRDALGASLLVGCAPALQAMSMQGDAAHAVAAASVLAGREMLPAQHPRLDALLQDDDPAVAAQAWRVLATVDSRLATLPEGVPPRPYKAALLRDDPALRHAVLACAAWSAQPWAVQAARRLAERGCPVALGWWAALAAPAEGAAIFGAAQGLPPLDRAALFARWGDPRVLPWLVQAMQGDDVALAAAALQAYERITAADIRGGRATPPLPEGASDFDRDMAPSVWLPDRVALDAHHTRHAAQWPQAERWNRGLPLGAAPGDDVLRRVDLPARWDALARAALARRPLGAAPPPV